jgi:hypothetical protein
MNILVAITMPLWFAIPRLSNSSSVVLYNLIMIARHATDLSEAPPQNEIALLNELGLS